VFVVGHLRNWRPTAEVLFESDCLRRDTKKGRRKGEETPRSFIPSIANTLQTTCHEWSRADGFNMIAYENHPSDCRVKPMGDVCQTVTSSWGTGGGNVPFVQNVAYGFEPGIAKREGNLSRFSEEISPTLRADMGDNQVATAFVWDTTNITSPFNGSNPKPNDPCHTLAKGQHPPLLTGMSVRRLTPIECERLQGFLDNYTNIPKAADGNRYKALGNSMAVPVMRWIGERINSYETMCSKAVVQVETGMGIAEV
jgi:DNA (cytosine-5)-methyltransferase 1